MLDMIIAATLAGTAITAPGPQGDLAGTLVDAGKGSPVVIIIPGSGPTDRDGNNPAGVNAAYLKMLADGLADQGISSVRIDKRGMFGSQAAIPDANKVTIADYANDAHSWAKVVSAATGADCVWLIGHSEGGLVALAAGQDGRGICGIVTISAAGRPLGTVIREQLRANPVNAPLLADADKALAEIEAGRAVDVDGLPVPLRSLFNASVQPYLIDLVSHDPAKLAASLRVPLLIVQGDRDLQVSLDDAKRLASAQPDARLVVIEGANHVLKAVEREDRAANLAAYGNADLPLAAGLVDAIAAFVKR